MKVALLSCTKSKLPYECMARELYSPSTYFSSAYEYASLIADKTYILSLKHSQYIEGQITNKITREITNSIGNITDDIEKLILV